MSTAHALSTGILGASRPLEPFVGSCTVSVEPKPRSARQTGSSLHLVACSLSHPDGSDVAFRKKESYRIKQREPYFVESQKPDPVELLLDLATRLHTTERAPPAVPAVSVPKRRSHKPRVILIAGPTAVGKTCLSIQLAKAIGGEIINADSVQVYQGLDVGAGKATLEERQGIPHHLLDMVPPTGDYPYERFRADSRAATQDILARGLVPIVVGGTGMYMRYFMHDRPNLTSHPFPSEDVTGEFDFRTEWDYDFQAYFLYQHRAELFPRVDIRCEQMVPGMLEETSALLDLGVEPHSNSAADAIGYEEAMQLLLEARQSGGIVTEERFLEFLRRFQHSAKGLVRKQIAWFRNWARSDVRQFRWIQVGQPAQMVDALVREYERPVWKESELQSGKDIVAASFQEQKRMQSYRRTLKVYSDTQAVGSTLRWIKSTQGSI